MKRILGLALSNLATLSMISLTFAPVSDVSAYSKNDCCEEECAPACESNMWCWLGGALLGAAAGAGTGYAASQDGRRGRTGDTGPAGPAGTGIPGATGATGATGAPGTFAVDLGETLTFNQSFTPTVGIGATITPYVAFPDGTVLLGTPVTILGLVPIAFAPFVINDPQFGEYNTGIQVDGGLFAVAGTLSQNAVASVDSSTTAFNVNAAVSVLVGTQVQVNADYTYIVSSFIP